MTDISISLRQSHLDALKGHGRAATQIRALIDAAPESPRARKNVAFHMRLSEAQKIKLQDLGGSAWLRARLDALAKAPAQA